MAKLFVRRLVVSIPLVISASLLVFVLVAHSGDPLAELRGQPNVTPQAIRSRRHELHLDQPVLVRYGRWLTHAVRGDLGKSLTGRDVGELLSARMQVTLRMVALATALAVVVAVALGVLSAVRAYSVWDDIVGAVSFVLLSLPAFWVGGLLKEFLAVRLNRLLGHQLVFTVGDSDANLSGALWHRVGNYLGHLALPTIALAVAPIAVWSRYLRASMLEALSADHLTVARAKGLSRRRVLLHHALRNALAPFVTLVALDFGYVIGGAVVVERVFAWQGMGQMLLDGVTTADPNVVSAWLLVTATAVIGANLAADLAYAWLDPRASRG